jgi:predicted aspartyl protease
MGAARRLAPSHTALMRGAWLIGVVLGACAHPHAPPSVTVPIGDVADGQIIVPVTVNGLPMKFLLDTGSPSTLITPFAAIQLGITVRDRGWVAVGAGGGVDPLKPVVLDVQIGAVGYWVQAFVAPFDGRALDRSLAGVLGQDFLSRNDVEIDFARGRLRLLPPGTAPHVRDEVALHFVDNVGMLQVHGTLDGRAVDAVLDLGATASIVNEHGAPGVAPKHRATAIGADGNPVTVYSHGFSRLALGDATFPTPTIYVGDLPLFSWLDLDGGPALLIGIDLLYGRRLVIDYRHHILRIGPTPLVASD